MAKDPKDDRPTCFVIMPVTTTPEYAAQYNDDQAHFLHVLNHIFTPALERCGYRVIPPVSKGADHIQADIIKRLVEADMVLCDMSGRNANVFFELGVRTALNKPVCMVLDKVTERAPFDVGSIVFHKYDGSLHAAAVAAEIPVLAAHVEAAKARNDNALWSYYGLSVVGAPPEPGSDEGLLREVLAEVQGLSRQNQSGNIETNHAHAAVSAGLQQIEVRGYEDGLQSFKLRLGSLDLPEHVVTVEERVYEGPNMPWTVVQRLHFAGLLKLADYARLDHAARMAGVHVSQLG